MHIRNASYTLLHFIYSKQLRYMLYFTFYRKSFLSHKLPHKKDYYFGNRTYNQIGKVNLLKSTIVVRIVIEDMPI